MDSKVYCECGYEFEHRHFNFIEVRKHRGDPFHVKHCENVNKQPDQATTFIKQELSQETKNGRSLKQVLGGFPLFARV